MKVKKGKHKVKTHLMNCFIIATLAAIWVFTAEYFGLIVWIAFLIWSIYFLAKLSFKQGVQAFLSLLIGVCVGCCAEILISYLEPHVGHLHLHAPIGIFIAVFLVIAFELVPYLVGPAVIIGASTFFGSKLPASWMSYVSIVTVMFFGVVLCYLSKYLMDSYECYYDNCHPEIP